MTMLSTLARQSQPPGAGKVLYVVPHQDDEVLMVGAAIKEEVTAGKDVHVLITTDGSAGGSRTMPALTNALGFTPDVADFMWQRNKEFRETVRRLGATPIIPGIGNQISDGGTSATNVAPYIKKWAPHLRGAALRGTAPTDYHTDHRNVGNGIVQLWAEGWGVDPRLCLAHRRADLMPAGVTVHTMGKHGDITAHEHWAYQHRDLVNGWWGIGYVDAQVWFDYQINANCTTLWHRPVGMWTGPDY